MAKARIWSSGAGIISMLFYVIALAGFVFQFLELYLYEFQNNILPDIAGNVNSFIVFIVFCLGALLALLAIIISIFKIPKVLWILFALGSLACIAVGPIIWIIKDGGFANFEYIKTTFDSMSFTMDGAFTLMEFIGFWAGLGGSLLAMIVGFFVPADYDY